MARTKGDFPFSANFEVKKKATLDARQYVNNYSELLEFTNDDYIPYGFPVACGGQDDYTKLGIWQCVNPNDLSNPLSWVRSNEPIPFNQVIQIGSYSFDDDLFIATLGETLDWVFNEDGINITVGDTNVQLTAPDDTLPRVDIISWNSIDGYTVTEGTPSNDPAVPNTPVGDIFVRQILRNIDGTTESPEPPDLSGYAQLTSSTTQTFQTRNDFLKATRNQQGILSRGFYWNLDPINSSVVSDGFAAYLSSLDGDNLRVVRTPDYANIMNLNRTTRVVDFGTIPTVNGVPIGTGGGGGAVDSVNGQTGVVVLDADDIDDTSTTNKFTTEEDKNLLYNTASTGILSFDGLSISADTTKFDVGAIKAWYVDNTDPINPTKQLKTFAASTANTVDDIATQNVTYIAIDIDGLLLQSGMPFEPEEQRDVIPLGVIVHSDRTVINAVNNQPVVASNVSNQLSDLMESIGFFNISGNVFTPNGANLNINKSAGHVFKQGSNFLNNNKDPHTLVLSALTAPTNLRYRLQDGTEYSNTNVIDPNNWDDNGVLTAMTGTRWSIQRIYMFQSNLVRIQYGQATYATKADAIEAIPTEAFTVEQNILENGLFRGLLVVRRNTTDLTDITRALFIEASKFGSVVGLGSLSTTSLQQAYDNSLEPEITTNTTLGAVGLRRGSASDTDTVLEIQNEAGTVTASIKGNGEILGANLSGTNTGDETTATIQTKRPLKTIEGQSLEGSGNIDLTKSDVGLANVDNTSDVNKPVSTAQQTALDLKQNLDATLTALAAYNTNGILTQTAADTFTGRTLTGTTNQVTVTNGNGVSGNPTLSLPQDIHTTATPQFTRIGLSAAANAAAYITAAANTTSVGQLYFPPSAVDYTSTLSGMFWNNASEWKFYDGVLGSVNRFIKLNGNSILANSNSLNVVTSTGTGGNLGTLKAEVAFGRYPTAVSYTVSLNDVGFGWKIAVTSTSSARTITLPLANTVPSGWQITIKDESGAAGTNNITIALSGSDTTDTTNITTNGGSRTLYSDGVSKWFQI